MATLDARLKATTYCDAKGPLKISRLLYTAGALTIVATFDGRLHNIHLTATETGHLLGALLTFAEGKGFHEFVPPAEEKEPLTHTNHLE